MDDETQTTGVQDAPAADATAQADTAASQDSSADVQVNNEAPEATQEVKEPVEKAEDTADERLYAGKYKSVDDLEKSYQELQSKATKDAMEKAELAKILNEAFAAPEPQQAQVQQDDYGVDEPDPVAQKLDALERSQVVQNFIFTHTDADADSMQKVLSSDPTVKLIPDYNAKLQYAYAISKNMSTQKAIEEAKKQSATAAQAKYIEKQAAQVETVKKQGPPVDNKDGLSPSELRNTLRDDKAFDELIKKRFPGVSKMRSR